VAHDYFEMDNREVDVPTDRLGRVRLHVRTAGEGPPLLLVHGLMTSGYSFRHVVGPLARGHALVVPDLPGAGRSAPLDRPLRPEALAELLVSLVTTLGIRGCRVVGNSMGGYLCLRAALFDPGAFSALIDVHSPGVPQARLWALSAALSTRAGRSILDALVRRDPMRWVHRNVHYRDESLKSLEEAREYGHPLSTRAGRDAFASYLFDALDPRGMRQLVAELEARRARGEPFPIPLSLLYSTEDPMVPPGIGRRLAELLPSAEVEWLEESSHFCHVDSPERFVEVTEAFFRRAAAR
jgi:pimeloyl-ACP methyl ester carboxylesterase